MDRKAYDDYLSKFQARDYEGVLDCYADDLEIVFAGYALRSKDEVRRFYGWFHEHVREEIEVRRFVADERTIALEADVRLTGLKPLTPEILAAKGFERLMGPEPGQTIVIPQFIHYHLKDGKFARALCAVFEAPRA